MLVDRLLDEAPSYENQLSENENEYKVRAFDISLQESKGKEIYTDAMELPQINEEQELAKALEQSMISSKKSSTGTGGRGLKWWKLFKELKLFHSSKGTSLRGKNINNNTNIPNVILQLGSGGIKSSKQRNILVCDVCEEQICLARCRYSYWGQTVCKKHRYDGTPYCCACSRFKIGDIKYIALSDGRKLCPDCRYTAVMNPEDCKPLLDEVHRFFDGLNMKIRYDIPTLLVDQEQLIRIQKSTVVGSTIFEKSKVEAITYVSKSIPMGENIEVVKEVKELLPPRRKVKAVLLLYCRPKLDVGSTLAHEMIHAWMRIKGYKGLRKNISEGLSQVMAHKWLEWQSFIGDDYAQFLSNLKDFLKVGIENHPSKVYGHGFREAKWAVERYGLSYTLVHIARTRKLPE